MKPSENQQVDDVIYAFMQVWSQFDSALPAEMANIQARVGGLHNGKEPHYGTNYEVFYRVSTNLSRRGSMTMSELSSALSVPMSTATRIADWMVARGYMSRREDAQDRRVVRVALTNSGLEFHENIQDSVRKRLQQMLSCLAPDERRTLFGLVHKVVSSSKEVG